MPQDYDEYEDDFQPPEMDAPDPDADDPRSFAKRRRRAPAPTGSAGTDGGSQAKKDLKPLQPPPGQATSVAAQDWGFEDDEEKSFIAEWKLGVALVIVLVCGFGLVAWKKYDAIKAIAQEKLESIGGGEKVAGTDGPDTDKDTPSHEVDPLSTIALDPPEKPRRDGITVADSSYELKQPTKKLNALTTSLGDESTPTHLAGGKTVPPPNDVGWGLPKEKAPQQPEPKKSDKQDPIEFDFGLPPQTEPSPTLAKDDKPAKQPTSAVDPFGDVLGPNPVAMDLNAKPPKEAKPSLDAGGLLADHDHKNPKAEPKRSADPFDLGGLDPVPSQPNEPPAMDLALDPIDVDPFGGPANEPKKETKPAKDPSVAPDPFSFDLPEVATLNSPKPEPMSPVPSTTPQDTIASKDAAGSKTVADPFQLDPVETLTATPVPAPRSRSPFDPLASDPVSPEKKPGELPMGTARSREPEPSGGPLQLDPLGPDPLGVEPLGVEPLDMKPKVKGVVPPGQRPNRNTADPFSLDSLPSAPARDRAPSMTRQPTPKPAAPQTVIDPFAPPEIASPQAPAPRTQMPASGLAAQPARSPSSLPPVDLGGGLDPLPNSNPWNSGTRNPVAPAPAPSRNSEPGTGPMRVDVAIDTRTYTVGDGESYWTISKKQYGTVRYFGALAEHNRDVVSDPRYLRPGMKIELPPADVLEPLVSNSPMPSIQPRPANVMATLRPEAHTARRHEVQPGENYWSISKKEYGTSRYFAALAEWNKVAVPDPRQLRPGHVVELPPASDLEPLVATASPNGPAPPRSTDTGSNGYFKTASGEPRYRVGPNETLGSIAQQMLGRASRADQIYALNRDVLRTPNSVPVGAVLKLPFDVLQTATR